MKTIRLAMTGARGHHGLVLRELVHLPEVELVAAATGGDSVEPIVQACREQGRPAPSLFDDHAEMLDDVRPDAVVVCGPFERHADMCVAALNRGVHVYTEKPAALTAESLRQLRRAASDRPDLQLVGMMQGRYAPGFYQAWRRVRAGAVGHVRLIDARKSYKLGTRPPYYHDRATYGGTIPWVGSHAIDWVMWLAGDSVDFRRVTARHHDDPTAGVGSMERSAACLFELSDRCLATVSLDVYRPAQAPSHGDDWVRVVGTTGVIEARPNDLRWIDPAGPGHDPAPTCDRAPFADFISAVARQRPALITARDTLRLTEACLLARQSADEQRTIEFPPENEPA